MTTHDTSHPDDDQPVDLTALWPDRAQRFASLAARIEIAARPELARRAARVMPERMLDGVVSLVARFARPALVAAAAAIAIAVASSRRMEPSTADLVASGEGLSEASVRQALGAEPNALLGAQDSADTEELVRAMYGGGGQE